MGDALLAVDFAEAAKRWTQADAAAVAAIGKLAGKKYARTVIDAVAVGAKHGLHTPTLLGGMIAAASDGTPGDMAMAAVVLAIAFAESHPLFGDLLQGRLKVDAVPATVMPGGRDHRADYVTVAHASGAKGDTIYLPNSFARTNAYHWSIVVHELEHAVQDKKAGGGNVQWSDRALAELAGYKAQGKSLMTRLAAAAAAERTKMAAQIGAEWTDGVALGMIIESRGDAAKFGSVDIEKVNNGATGMKIPPAMLKKALGLPAADLEKAAVKWITSVYKIGTATTKDAPFDGFAGDSVVDFITRL